MRWVVSDGNCPSTLSRHHVTHLCSRSCKTAKKQTCSRCGQCMKAVYAVSAVCSHSTQLAYMVSLSSKCRYSASIYCTTRNKQQCTTYSNNIQQTTRYFALMTGGATPATPQSHSDCTSHLGACSAGVGDICSLQSCLQASQRARVV